MSDSQGRQCTECGGRIVDFVAAADEPGLLPELCYDCRLNRWIPEWFSRAEEYSFPPGQLHKNATRRPRTDRPILDEVVPPIGERLAGLTEQQIAAMQAREAQQGIDEHELNFN